MCRFLDLPREVRNLIYEQALIVRLKPVEWTTTRVRLPILDPFHKTIYNANQRPSVKLLRANKFIHSEAAAVLYGKNIFRFPPFAKLGKISIFTKYATLFRHIIVYFSLRETLSLEVWLEGRIPNEEKHMIAVVEMWKRKKEILVPMTQLRTCHAKLCLFPLYGGRSTRWNGRLSELAIDFLPLLRDWALFLASRTDGKRTPKFSAGIASGLSSLEHCVVEEAWKTGGVEYRDMIIGHWPMGSESS